MKNVLYTTLVAATLFMLFSGCGDDKKTSGAAFHEYAGSDDALASGDVQALRSSMLAAVNELRNQWNADHTDRTPLNMLALDYASSVYCQTYV